MSQRRGQCPTLAMPMATGDGLLARMNPISGGVSPATLAAIAEAAARFGNGLIEVTARGSLQIRGLSAESAPRLAAAVDALDIAVRSGVPVETGPLAGLDQEEITDARPLAEAIRAGIAKAGLAQRLGPKVSVVVDGGGQLRLNALLADVRLEAVATDGAALWRVSIGGTAESARVLGLVPEADAAKAAIAILEAVAAKGQAARARELTGDEVACVLAVRSVPHPSALPGISRSRGEIGRPFGLRQSATKLNGREDRREQISPLEREMPGRAEGGGSETSSMTPVATFPLSDTRVALGVALPFGQATAVQMNGLAKAAEQNGAHDIRFAPGRALLLLAPTDEAAALAEATNTLGFITEAADPRLSIVACAGTPACVSGHLAARELAAELATDATGGALAPGEVLHISGCAKQCAKPAHAAFTLIGTANGAELYTGDGAAPIARVAIGAAADAFRRAARLDRQENISAERPVARGAQAG